MSLFSAREKGRLSEYQKWDYIVSEVLNLSVCRILTHLTDVSRLHPRLNYDTPLLLLAMVPRHYRSRCLRRRHLYRRHPSCVRPLVQSDQTKYPFLHFEMDLRRLYPLLLVAGTV